MKYFQGYGSTPPAHEWRNETELRWVLPDGTWGEWHDLGGANLDVTEQDDGSILVEKRWQWGDNVRLDPEGGLVMRDEETGDWLPLTLSGGQLQIG